MNRAYKPDVYIGMSCDENLKYVSLIGDTWDVPMVSVGSRGDELRNGRLRPMKTVENSDPEEFLEDRLKPGEYSQKIQSTEIHSNISDFDAKNRNWQLTGDRRTLIRIGPTSFRLADAVLSYMMKYNFSDISLIRLKDHSPKERVSQSHHANPVDVKTPHDCHLYAGAIQNYLDLLNKNRSGNYTVHNVEWNIQAMFWNLSEWDQEIKVLLKKAATRSRLFFWCVEPVAMDKILMKAFDTFIESDEIFMAGQSKFGKNETNGFVHLYFDPNIWIPGTKPWKDLDEFQIPDGPVYNDNHTIEERFDAYRSMVKIGRNTPNDLEYYQKMYESWFGHFPGECHPSNKTEPLPDPSTYADYLPFRNQCYTPYAGDYHDSVLLTAEAIRLCLDDWERICTSLTPDNKCTQQNEVLPECLKGTTFVSYARNITNFTGVHGTYSFDKIADSSASYGFYDLDYDLEFFKKVGYYDSYEEKYGEVNDYVEVGKTDWPGRSVPVNKPFCGFAGEDQKCAENIPKLEKSTILYVIIGSLVLIAGFLVGMLIRNFWLKWKAKRDSWIIREGQVSFDPKKQENCGFDCEIDAGGFVEDVSAEVQLPTAPHCQIGIYRLSEQTEVKVVAVKLIDSMADLARLRSVSGMF